MTLDTLDLDQIKKKIQACLDLFFFKLFFLRVQSLTDTISVTASSKVTSALAKIWCFYFFLCSVGLHFWAASAPLEVSAINKKTRLLIGQSLVLVVCGYVKPSGCPLLSWQLTNFCIDMVLVSWCRCTLTTALSNESWNFGFFYFFLNTEWNLILSTMSFFNSCEMGFGVGGIPFRIICQAYSVHEACPCGTNQFDQSDRKKGVQLFK